jgi:hypothetical protein
MIQYIKPKSWQFYQWLVSGYNIWVQCIYVNVIKNYVEAIIKCRYRLTTCWFYNW